jgi:hypothetical protein
MVVGGVSSRRSERGGLVVVVGTTVVVVGSGLVVGVVGDVVVSRGAVGGGGSAGASSPFGAGDESGDGSCRPTCDSVAANVCCIGVGRFPVAAAAPVEKTVADRSMAAALPVRKCKSMF